MSNCLVIEHLSKTYQKTGVEANQQISCRFEAGFVHALLGHNGAGKTTLLNQLMGLLEPDQGTVTFADLSLLEHPQQARELISMMPQLHAPIRGLTARQAIGGIGKLRGLSGLELEQAIEAVLTALDIEEWRDRKVEKLSGGLLRLVSFAMAVIAPPPILLLDEPTNDVDPVRRILLWKYLQQLASQGHVVVLVTHNLLEVQTYADCYYFFHKGELLKSGWVADLSGERQFWLEFKPVGEVTPPVQVGQTVAGWFRIQVSEGQVPAILEWLGQEVVAGRIQEYDLGWLDLNEIYGGWINAAETT